METNVSIKYEVVQLTDTFLLHVPLNRSIISPYFIIWRTHMSNEKFAQIDGIFEGLSPEDIAAYLATKQNLLDEHKQKEKVKAIDEVYATAKKYDFRISTNIDEKFTNPKAWNKETGQTWAGNGGQPAWLVAAIKSGKTIEDFKVE